MHTGPVVIADGGEVFGETANVALRVQGAAEPDTAVITAATQRLVEADFRDAIALARTMQAKAFELRATTRLHRAA